jgi:hypothetical protein
MVSIKIQQLEAIIKQKDQEISGLKLDCSQIMKEIQECILFLRKELHLAEETVQRIFPFSTLWERDVQENNVELELPLTASEIKYDKPTLNLDFSL